MAHDPVAEGRPGGRLPLIDGLGPDGVLDLVQLVSLYLATAAQLNAFRVPAPPSA